MPPTSRSTLLLLAAGFAVPAAVVGWMLADPEQAAPPPAAVERPNFLVIDIDTLSLGHLGSTRDGEPVTPNLDALAARGVSFSHMVTQAGWTMPSLTSLLTGRLPIPSEIGTQGRIGWEERSSHDIAEVLGLYDYQTAAAWGATVAGPARKRKIGSFAEALGAQVLPDPAVLQWLSLPPAEPFLLFLHEVDLHHSQAIAAPGDPPSKGGPSYESTYRTLADERGQDAARDEILARYDAQLTVYDARVGEILAVIDANGMTDRTVVIVVSDHGEDLFSHTVADHGMLYDTVLRVPLIIVDPAAPRRGEVDDTVVQTVDIAPTVLARAGVPLDAEMDGQSLLSLLGLPGEPYVERPVTSMTDSCSFSRRADGYKLIVTSRPPTEFLVERRAEDLAPVVRLDDLLVHPWLPGDAVPDCKGAFTGRRGGAARVPAEEAGASGLFVELYNLAEDPEELDNVASERLDVLEQALPELLRWRKERAAAAADAPKEGMSAEQEKALREQGYWGHVDRSGDGAGRPPPPRGPVSESPAAPRRR